MKDLFVDYHKYGIAGYNKLIGSDVPRWVMEKMIELQGDYYAEWIIRCFLILALNALLFPTSSLFIAGTDYIAFEELEKAQEYDWCKKICDDVVPKSLKFQADREASVSMPCLQGCLLFLMVSNTSNSLLFVSNKLQY